MSDIPLFFDSHAHLTSKALSNQADTLADRSWSAGVRHVINICTDRDSLEKGLLLAQRHPWILNAGATTPHDVDKEGEELFPIFAEQARNGSLVAVGETGLDYFYEHSDREIQKTFLRRYLALAVECDLPVVIHCREAFQDLFDILDSDYCDNGKHRPGVLHCFTGTIQEAEQVIQRGWYLSLSGIVTFKKSEELRQVARMVPLDHLLIETDAPYLAPQSHRGKTNEPSYVPETAQVIADVKGLTITEVAKATWHNASTLFRL
ncbi:MAG: TatD family hydrolase [Chlamydiales bacterium]|nr:TatD family hydrolase [Chlamydiales bacterium]